MIISLHMPKCGGSSFEELLRDHFGWRYAQDYDFPIHKSFEERTRQADRARRRIAFAHQYLFRYRFVQCLHGHFLPYKYDYFHGREGTIFVTWLRDPIERLVSHYHFWLREYELDDPKPLHRRVVEEEWTLEEFAFSEELQNFYTTFLWNFPLEQFDFIGITEHYEEDHTYFAKRYLGLDEVSVPKKNVNPDKSKPSLKDPGLIRDLKSFHARDYELYNQALEMRKQRSDFAY